MCSLKKLILLIPFVALIGCATDNAPTALVPTNLSDKENCLFPNNDVAPKWVCNDPVGSLKIQAVGIAEKSRVGYSDMIEIAKLNAIGHLSDSVKLDTSKMVKRYMSKSGNHGNETIDLIVSSTINNISSATLSGAKIYRRVVGPEGRVYVLVGLNSQEQTLMLNGALRSSHKNDSVLWQEFKASKSHKELAEKVIEYNEQ